MVEGRGKWEEGSRKREVGTGKREKKGGFEGEGRQSCFRGIVGKKEKGWTNSRNMKVCVKNSPL